MINWKKWNEPASWTFVGVVLMILGVLCCVDGWQHFIGALAIGLGAMMYDWDYAMKHAPRTEKKETTIVHY